MLHLISRVVWDFANGDPSQSRQGNWIVDVGVHFAAALRLTLGDVEVAACISLLSPTMAVLF